jgi:hypothetical protein
MEGWERGKRSCEEAFEAAVRREKPLNLALEWGG